MTGSCVIFVGSLNRETPYFQGARGAGLSVYSFDENTLETRRLAVASNIDNPTFLSVSEDGTRVYANSEVFGWHEGLVTAFRFDRSTNTLAYINTQPALGSITAHNTITRDGTKLLVANYGMGDGGPDQSVVVFGFREDGGLTPPIASAAHRGSGPNMERQERSHAHSITEMIQGDFAVVADLGLDRLISYQIGSNGSLERIAETALASGSGPRHAALHPNGRFLFVLNELNSTASSFALDSQTGHLSLVDTQPAVPAEAREHNHCADIQISPDGRFLYGSNRGHDSIAVFAVNQGTGALSLVEFCPCGGATPRNLGLSPSGRHLFSANQNSDKISIFARDEATGKLKNTGHSIETGTPMCVRIVSNG